MTLQYLNAGPMGFRFGEYVNGVFYGVIVRGTGLTYDANGVPDGGTLRSMTFENTSLNLAGVRDDIARIVFPTDFAVTSLTEAGFDWFASATTNGSEVTIDGTVLITGFDNFGFHALDLPLDFNFRYVNVTTGAQDDRVYGTDNPDFLANISTGAGNDRITAAGRDIRVDSGADNDRITLDSMLSTVVSGSGRDNITVTGQRTSIQAGDDNDKVSVLVSENVMVSAGSGNDAVTVGRVAGASSYNAVVRGMDGRDTITGSDYGRESLFGDAGNDVIDLRGATDGQAEEAHGGSGNDRVTGGQGTGYQGLFGEAGNDTLTAGDAPGMLLGGQGNDLLISGAGSTSLFVEHGLDTVVTGAGQDIVILYNPAATSRGLVIDFDLANDVIVIDTSANLNAADSYELFLDHAMQVGSDTVYDDGAGHVLTLQGIDLADITAAHIAMDYITGLFPVVPDAT
jgi:Ca2+-binding RTX toxin-like protein